MRIATRNGGNTHRKFKLLGTYHNSYARLVTLNVGFYWLLPLPLTLEQWYSTFFVRVPPDIISLQLCTPRVVGT
jgi:hypothetical protein